MMARSLCAAGALALLSGLAPQPVSAQTLWTNGGSPVFASQIAEQRRKREAARAAARARARARLSDGGGRPTIKPKAPPVVSIARDEAPGTVIVDTKGRRLFYILGKGKAYRYPISVGRRGFTWTGTHQVSAMRRWPSWTPPPEMRRRQSWLPLTMSGGIRNPLGAQAIYLGSTLYRIHGTNDPKSIGRAASSGCFRMMNHHVRHLAGLVEIGTPVHVVKRYNAEKPGPALSTANTAASAGGTSALSGTVAGYEG